MHRSGDGSSGALRSAQHWMLPEGALSLNVQPCPDIAFRILGVFHFKLVVGSLTHNSHQLEYAGYLSLPRSLHFSMIRLRWIESSKVVVRAHVGPSTSTTRCTMAFQPVGDTLALANLGELRLQGIVACP